MQLDIDIIAWVLNVLLIIAIGVSGFWLKSLYNKVEKTKEELDRAKEVCEGKFTSKVVCDQKHININESMQEMKDSSNANFKRIENSMNTNFERLYNKVDVANSIGEGIKELGKVIKDLNGD